MKDPYEEVFAEIGKAFLKVNKMIVELAKRSLTVNEYQEFAKTFEKKPNKEASEWLEADPE